MIFTYIGSHDDCQRWIENNRDYQDEIDSEPVPPPATEKPESEAVCNSAEPERDEYEEQLMAKIDERLLRELFAGLYKNDLGRKE